MSNSNLENMSKFELLLRLKIAEEVIKNCYNYGISQNSHKLVSEYHKKYITK